MNLYFIFIQEESVLPKYLTKEEGCYQDFKPPWQTYESGLFHGFPGITLSQNPCSALGPVKLSVMCSSRHPLRIPVDVRGLCDMGTDSLLETGQGNVSIPIDIHKISTRNIPKSTRYSYRWPHPLFLVCMLFTGLYESSCDTVAFREQLYSVWLS